MKYLLDINVLLAAAWANHPHFAAADAWLKGKAVVVCPLVELGFLRISANRRAIGAPMKDARKALENLLTATRATRIPDDLPALESRAEHAEQVTDHYLAALAQAPWLQVGNTGRRHQAFGRRTDRSTTGHRLICRTKRMSNLGRSSAAACKATSFGTARRSTMPASART